MARKKEDTNKIEHGSDLHISALENAYRIRKAVAEKVVKEFESGEKDWDVGYYERCKNFMEIVENPKPEPVSTRKGWKRSRSY